VARPERQFSRRVAEPVGFGRWQRSTAIRSKRRPEQSPLRHELDSFRSLPRPTPAGVRRNSLGHARLDRLSAFIKRSASKVELFDRPPKAPRNGGWSLPGPGKSQQDSNHCVFPGAVPLAREGAHQHGSHSWARRPIRGRCYAADGGPSPSALRSRRAATFPRTPT